MSKFTELNSKEKNETNGGFIPAAILVADLLIPAVGISAAWIYNKFVKSDD